MSVFIMGMVSVDDQFNVFYSQGESPMDTRDSISGKDENKFNMYTFQIFIPLYNK